MNPLISAVYNQIMNLSIPLWRMVGYWRQKKGKEDISRFKERLGISNIARPQGPLVWFHGASIGETRAALAIIHILSKLHPHITILLTSQTASALKSLSKDLPESVIHQYAPYDVPIYIKRFLKHWQPQAFCVVEAEFWPVTWATLKKNKIPLFLCNFHISEKSFKRWMHFPSFFNYFYGLFHKRWCGCSASYQRFKKIAPHLRLHLMPSLKYVSPLLQKPQESFSTSGRSSWFASCVHAPEEELILTTHQKLHQEIPDLVLFYGPRHIDRVPFIEEWAQKQGWKVQKRTTSRHLEKDTDIYLIDTFGELGLFYSSFDFTVLCGSFSTIGGHNVIEPLSMGCAVIAGADMKNNQDTAHDFFQKRGALQVSAENLSAQILHWIQNPQEPRAYALNALETLALSHQQVGKIVESIANDIKHSFSL